MRERPKNRHDTIRVIDVTCKFFPFFLRPVRLALGKSRIKTKRMDKKMKKKNQKKFCIAFVWLALFALWTTAICYLDVRAIGPKGSSVGFAGLNGFFHSLTGVHMQIYTITDWLSLVPLGFMMGFAILGLVQLIKRRSLWKVDADILVLGVFYILVLAAYVLFEIFIINYRPVLMEGFLEASYPSSTTLLVMCVMPTAIMQLRNRIKNEKMKKVLSCTLTAFTAFMVIGRLVSGVHWLTDIIGGALLSMGLVMLYDSVCSCLEQKKSDKSVENGLR